MHEWMRAGEVVVGESEVAGACGVVKQVCGDCVNGACF